MHIRALAMNVGWLGVDDSSGIIFSSENLFRCLSDGRGRSSWQIQGELWLSRSSIVQRGGIISSRRWETLVSFGHMVVLLWTMDWSISVAVVAVGVAEAFCPLISDMN
jgi:hypothetical protein